ncbi:uncharacterized protein LOC132257480 [Phlebotomus argentipes]|uniref:uncharacterized protein LOC132257480 n=1 Tax=Phlebotomus argentipes TaxID=94469 RepID=UPI002892D931|nr:uncharacterized protein LOC132257480 [Phlebotomus argentipes]
MTMQKCLQNDKNTEMTSSQSRKRRKGKISGTKVNESSSNADNIEEQLAMRNEIDDDPNSGFASYLKSSQGLDMMRLFVVANSLVVFITMAWPSIKDTFEIIRDFIYGENLEDI